MITSKSSRPRPEFERNCYIGKVEAQPGPKTSDAHLKHQSLNIIV